MKVHIIRTEEVSDELYAGVFSFLNGFPGPMKFISDEEAVVLDEDELYDYHTNENKFFKRRDVAHMQIKEMHLSHKIVIPQKVSRTTWETLFEKCKNFREENEVENGDAVVLLTNITNEHNWFSAFDPDGGMNIFVHADHWEHYVPADSRYPVAYEMVTTVLHKLMFGNFSELEKFIHKNPKGCISDYCEDKRQVTLKMRTADICPKCQEIISQKNIPAALTDQCIRILDQIRTQLLFRERFQLFRKPSRITITPGVHDILFTDMGNAKLELTPLEKIVYLLFLHHPEGIANNEMDQHRQWLTEMYMQVAPTFVPVHLTKSINNIIGSGENSLSEKCSKIKSKIINLVGEEMAKHFIIEGERGGRKRIGLERGMVEWENIIY
jgi:hypothetical protein